TTGDIMGIQRFVESVHVEASLNNFIVKIVRSTREDEETILGGSPRSSLCLYKAAQAWALFSGRDYVVPDDVIQMAPHVLEHRILMRQEAKLRHVTPLDVVKRAVDKAIDESNL
ncbi:MAG: MoxR family ATPase, partial [Defluviitaleaceae bacterium]|nr:MoxR family ATPase [Defluviitaleaceae bacterium]